MLPHTSRNFEVQKYYQNQPIFNGAYSRDNLLDCSSTEIKYGAYVINLDEYSDIGTHWVALYVHDVTYFHSFGSEHIPKEIKAFTDHSLSIATNIFRIQAYDSRICGYFCIGFIDLMLAGKTFVSLNNFTKNDIIIFYD